ncbi:hypothetical protein ACFV19_33600 [Streptomyces griseoluteus]|uniref:hypothetical protein n=1 Tax=Streptomyces griseoluteus TaxID=29306 RepID=UPI00368619E1
MEAVATALADGREGTSCCGFPGLGIGSVRCFYCENHRGAGEVGTLTVKAQTEDV